MCFDHELLMSLKYEVYQTLTKHENCLWWQSASNLRQKILSLNKSCIYCSFSMFNKPAKFEKQSSRGAISVSNDVNHVGSPTAVISKTVVEEVQSATDGKYEEVGEVSWTK